MQDLVDLDGRLELANRTIWSPLERSMICQRNGKFQSDATQPLAVFLRDVGSRMLSFLEAKDMDNVEDLQVCSALPFRSNLDLQRSQHDILIFWKILHYLRDIFDLTLSENFDEDIFQAYQSIGRSLCSQASSWAGVRGDIASELNAKLDTFNLSWQLSSGLGLDILWRALKPNTPRNLRQLELNLMVKGLADRFDAVKWKSGASVRELKDLQSSMTRLHTNVEACSSLDLSPLDVGRLSEIGELADDLSGHSNHSERSRDSRSAQPDRDFASLCVRVRNVVSIRCSSESIHITALLLNNLACRKTHSRVNEFGCQLRGFGFAFESGSDNGHGPSDR